MIDKNNKKTYLFGLMTGITVVAVIGFIIVLIMYLNNNGNEASDTLGDVNNNVNTDDTKPAPTPTSNKVNIKVSKDDHIRGNFDAPITIVEFSDFQCSYCSSFHNTLKQVLDEYPNDFRWVYKHFPLDSIHPYARKAAEASECASDQGKFEEYSDRLFTGQKQINDEYFPKLAKELGLNISEFEECLDSGKYASKVNNDFNYGRSIGVTGTPGAFINGVKMRGAESFSSVKARIDAILNK